MKETFLWLKIFLALSFSPKFNFRWRRSALYSRDLIHGFVLTWVFISFAVVLKWWLSVRSWATYHHALKNDFAKAIERNIQEELRMTFLLLFSSSLEVVSVNKELETNNTFHIERQCFLMNLQHTKLCELWIATMSNASSEVKKEKLGEGTELCLVHQQVKPKNFTGKSHGRSNSCRAAWGKQQSSVPSGVCFSSSFLPPL